MAGGQGGAGGGDGDKTILRPTPGRGRSQPGSVAPAPQAPAAPVSPRQPAFDAARPAQFVTSGINPLIGAAGPLFALAGQLREVAAQGDVAALAAHVSRDIEGFEAAAQAAGEPGDSILLARYSLCTLLDEVVLNTPWGMQSAWRAESLLARFHHETFGGEKFFQIVEKALREPAKDLHLLEFLDVCLALGLEGRYRGQQDGRRRLQTVIDDVYEAIRRQRGDHERELSPRWQGMQDRRPKLARYVPMWVLAAVAALVLLLTYVAFLFALSSRSDPVVTRIAELGRDVPVVVAPRAAAPAVRIGLADLLAADIREGLVQVEDLDGRSVVTLWELFPVGDAQVTSERRATLANVARALQRFPGSITVTGHTDNVPIRTLRFPSNWKLSELRAEAVFRELSSVLPADRLRAEGSGDSRPLQPNDSAANRAINRRVEITLVPDGPAL